jgi:nicotinamidase-related amidase
VTVAAVQALVLIDLQAGFVTGDQAVPGAASLLPRVTILLTRARTAGSLVVHVQNDGQQGALDEPGQPGWQLHFWPRSAEPVFRKACDDAFAETGLDAVLASHRVGRLAVAGLLSEMCVSATARTALHKGYGVVVPHDAHATYDIPAASGYGPAVPAAAVSRVAEWSLGDQAELVPSADEVKFAPAA